MQANKIHRAIFMEDLLRESRWFKFAERSHLLLITTNKKAGMAHSNCLDFAKNGLIRLHLVQKLKGILNQKMPQN
jgi:hypothetical protein